MKRRKINMALRTKSVLRAIAIIGGPAKTGAQLGISSQAVSQWMQAPYDKVVQLEELTSGIVKRHEMRPDLYPAPVE